MALDHLTVLACRVIASALVVVLAGACGGGGGDGTPQADASRGFLSDNGIHPPPVTGQFAYNSFGPGSPGFPSVGGTYTDPVFGATVRRLTNVPNAPNGDDIYAKHWANADGTLAFHRNTTGTHVIQVSTGARIRESLPQGLNGAEMHWDANNPDWYYYFDGKNLMRHSLAAQSDTLVHAFPSVLEDNGGSLNIQSGNGRYFTVRYGGTNKVWDSQTNMVYTGEVTPVDSDGWVSITPNASHIVTASGPGNEAYSYAIDHVAQSISATGTMFWNLCGDHGDLISPSDGNSYFVTGNCTDVPGVFRVDISSGASQLLFPVEWEDAGHYSCVGKGTFRDWCFYSSESTIDLFDSSVAGWTAFKQEIVAVNVLTSEVRRLAHHRSRSTTQAYQYEPRISSSWDGSVVMWASNFNIDTPAGYADLYAISSPLR